MYSPVNAAGNVDLTLAVGAPQAPPPARGRAERLGWLATRSIRTSDIPPPGLRTRMSRRADHGVLAANVSG